MKERTKFVLEWERLFEKNRGMVNVSELCRAYCISRPTGYAWCAADGAVVRTLAPDTTTRSVWPNQPGHAVMPELADADDVPGRDQFRRARRDQ